MIVALADGSLRCWDLSKGKERVIAQPKLKKPLDPAVVAALPLVPPTPPGRLLAMAGAR